MSRPTLGTTQTVLKQFKLPAELAGAFTDRCRELETTESAQLRSLVERWLKATVGLVKPKRGKAV